MSEKQQNVTACVYNCFLQIKNLKRDLNCTVNSSGKRSVIKPQNVVKPADCISDWTTDEGGAREETISTV